MIRIVEHVIDPAEVLAAVASPLAGAVVLFLGTTRQVTKGRQTLSLDYECYGPMAEQQLAELAETARRRWPLIGCAIIHRVGHVGLGETSVAVAVSSPHRQDAFEAGQWLIDTLKQVVPIWKQENWADGTSEWVHPGLGSPAAKDAAAKDAAAKDAAAKDAAAKDAAAGELATGELATGDTLARDTLARDTAAGELAARDDGDSTDTLSENQQ